PASFPNPSGGCVVTTTTSSTTSTTSTSTSTVAPTTTAPNPTTSTSTTVAPPTTTSTSLKLRDQSGPDSRRFSFKSSTKADPPANKVLVPGAGTAGDPTTAGATGGGARLDVYDSAGSGELVTVNLPAAGWLLSGKGYRFRAPLKTDPVQRVTVKGDSLRVRGGHASWAYTLDEASQ